MTGVAALLDWWNFIFILPLLAGLLLVVAIVVSGLGGELLLEDAGSRALTLR